MLCTYFLFVVILCIYIPVWISVWACNLWNTLFSLCSPNSLVWLVCGSPGSLDWCLIFLCLMIMAINDPPLWSWRPHFSSLMGLLCRTTTVLLKLKLHRLYWNVRFSEWRFIWGDLIRFKWMPLRISLMFRNWKLLMKFLMKLLLFSLLDRINIFDVLHFTHSNYSDFKQ